MLTSKLEKILVNCFAAALYIFCLGKFGSLIGRTLQCGDTGWLIKTGQYILAHGLPATDPFSFTCPDRPIVIYQWLFAVALGALFQHGGLWLVGLASAVVAALIYLCYLPASMIRLGVKPVYVFGLLSLASCPVFFWARPQLVSFVLIALFTLILEHLRTKGYDRLTWLLPPLMVLWANSHSFWFIGLLMVTAYLIAAILENKNERRSLGLVLLACFGAVLLNPYGWALVQYNISFTTEPDFGSIRELQPSLLLHPKLFVADLFYLALAWSAIIVGRRAVPLSGLLLAAIGSVAALMFYRFEPVAILLTWPYAGLALSKIESFQSAALKQEPANSGAKRLKLVTIILPILAIGCAMFSFMCQFPPEKPIWFTNTDTNLETTKFLKRHPDLLNRMFCDPAIGSSLIFENLAPVFIDTRFDFYGRQFCSEYNSCFDAEQGWQDYLSKWQVRSLCVDDNYPIYKALLTSKSWLVVFDDHHFSVWLPNNEAGKKRQQELAIRNTNE
ncbi:MAG: hypothetical protein WCT03_08195 [Candidatus Obscuribacterales bacterium]